MTAPLRVGLAGLGTVGAGVVKTLRANAAEIAARAGRPIEVVAVSARNRGRDRGVDLSATAWEDDPVALAARDDVDALVEVIGGSDGPARAACMKAIAAGKHVVTANKALLAHHGERLAAAAETAGVALRFEAAVAGGVPVVKALGEGLAANRLSRLYGVLNGTCNYILTEMERTGRDYAPVLAEAQARGYAEADPTFDVGGIDAAHKLALLAALGFGCAVDFAGVAVEGIERIGLADIAHAAELGYRIKLLGVARRTDAGIERAVRPCLVRADSAVGQLPGVTNAVVCEGEPVGQVVFEGPGAGEGATASAVVADLIDVARGARGPAFGVAAETLAPAGSVAAARPAPHYLRLRLEDRPGALAEIARDLGDEGVSIRAMRQHDDRAADGGGGATVLILTHACARASLDRALAAIAASPVCLAAPVALRIEEV
jgi:homoserine dehydrogenase